MLRPLPGGAVLEEVDDEVGLEADDDTELAVCFLDVVNGRFGGAVAELFVGASAVGLSCDGFSVGASVFSSAATGSPN